MNSRSHIHNLSWLVSGLLAFCTLTVVGQPMAPQATPTPSQASADPSDGLQAADRGGGDPAECTDGVIKDDGSAETGYGWVPSVIEGEYVQEFDAAWFSSRRLDSVCICWLRTRADATIDFEIVFYRQITDPEDDTRLIPAAEPYAVFPADAEVIPKGVTESFFRVDVSDALIPFGKSYIGARWDASRDQFFFICADHSEETSPVEVFFRDDRAEGDWASVFETTDPIFRDHKAIMIRAQPSLQADVDVPALGTTGLGLLAATLTALALWVLRSRQRPAKGTQSR